jgi:hypothetical protein
MASYVLKNTRVVVTESGTEYTTATNLLTVTSGHLYIIKKLKATIDIATGGAITDLNVLMMTSNSSGTNFAYSAPLIQMTSAGAVASTHMTIDFTADPLGTIATTPTDWTSFAVVSNKIYSLNVPAYKDEHLEAGKILKFDPSSHLTAGTTVANSNSTILTFDISYIDYTL